MGYCLNRLDESIFIAVSKPLLTEFGIHHRLESCKPFQLANSDYLVGCAFACDKREAAPRVLFGGGVGLVGPYLVCSESDETAEEQAERMTLVSAATVLAPL